MPKKNLLIIETRNSYLRERYESVLRYILGSNYEVEEHSRKFISHDSEADERYYSRFKMMVTKSEEEFIRNEIHKMGYPNYTFGGAR
jgi:hypothetical protein